MKRLQLDVSIREGRGKGTARKLRAGGMVPAVLYGAKLETTKVSVDGHTLERIVATARLVPDAAHWLVWSRYPYERIEASAEGWAVSFRDARYDARGGSELAGVRVLGPDRGPRSKRKTLTRRTF